MGKNKFIVTATAVLLFVSFLYVFFVIVQNKELYTQRFDPKRFENKYNNSQWVIPESKNIISDEDLYTYAGYRYLNGINPILVSPEVPPLGKYIIGGSIQIFQNQRVTSLLSALLSLVLVAYIVYMPTKSFFIMSLAVFLTSIQTLFIDQIIHAPQLDIFQLLFLLLFIISFLIFQKRKNIIFLLASGIAMGYFFSTKFFLINFVIFNGTLILFYILRKTIFRESLFQLILLNITSLIVYLFSYMVYFIQGGNLRSFLGVQKWIFFFYQSSKIDITKLFGNYISLILLNRWRFWTEGYPIIQYHYWSILWPIIFFLGLFSGYKLWKLQKKRPSDLVIFLISFLIIYNIFLFITPIYPRYLLLLFIPLNILTAVYIGKIIEKKYA